MGAIGSQNQHAKLLLGRWESYVFFAAMIAGMAIYQVANAYGAGRSIRGGITS